MFQGECLSEEVTFKWRPASRGASHGKMWEQRILGRGNSKSYRTDGNEHSLVKEQKEGWSIVSMG